MTVYSRQSSKSILRKGLAVFLEYRFTVSRGAPDHLLVILHKSVQKILEITNETSDDARFDYLKKSAIVMQNYCKDIQGLLVKPGKRAMRMSAKDTDDGLLLCLVAGMSDLKLAEDVLEHCSDLWRVTYCLGAPIEVAVCARDITMVETLLKKASQPSDKRKAASILGSIIQTKLSQHFESGMSEFLESLLLSHLAILGRPRAEYCIHWFCKALYNNNFNLLSTILDLGTTATLADQYREYWFRSPQYAWDIQSLKYTRQFNYAALEVLLTKKIFNVDKSYTVDFLCDETTNIHQESLLNYAVRVLDRELVYTVLEAEANPNGIVQSIGKREYPLHHVSSLDSEVARHIVELLLAYGADPNERDHINGHRPIDLVRKNGRMFKVLRKVIRKKRVASGR